jgi:soluble lytic murein transglycosylase-like protein
VFARTKLIALTAVAAVAVPVAASAAQAPAQEHAPAKHRSRAEIKILDRTTVRFEKSIDIAKQQIAQQQSGAPATGSTELATPESYGVSSATLNAIAACESGGNPAAVSSDGTYRGKYQFDYGTWASVGGSGDPAAAPEAEQDMRAAMLYARAGSSPWPICGA